MSDPLRVPLALDEAAIVRLFARDPRTKQPVADDALTGALDAMRVARGAAEQITTLVDVLRHDPTRTPAARGVELRRRVPEAAARAGDALDGAVQRLDRVVAALESEMAPKAPASVEAAGIAAELRTMLRAMDAAARSEALSKAVAAGDEAMVSAVLRAPAPLSGLTGEQHAGLCDRWGRHRHPEVFDRASRLRQAKAAVETAGRATVGFVATVMGDTAAAEDERRADEADATLARIRRERHPVPQPRAEAAAEAGA